MVLDRALAAIFIAVAHPSMWNAPVCDSALKLFDITRSGTCGQQRKIFLAQSSIGFAKISRHIMFLLFNVIIIILFKIKF
jgi:hypothetical protein